MASLLSLQTQNISPRAAAEEARRRQQRDQLYRPLAGRPQIRQLFSLNSSFLPQLDITRNLTAKRQMRACHTSSCQGPSKKMSLCERTYPGKELSESLEGTDDPPSPGAPKGAEPRLSRALDPRPQEQPCFSPASVSPYSRQERNASHTLASQQQPRGVCARPSEGQRAAGARVLGGCRLQEGLMSKTSISPPCQWESRRSCQGELCPEPAQPLATASSGHRILGILRSSENT